MRFLRSPILLVGLGFLSFTSAPVRAEGQLSPERLDVVDQFGYFTPGFKKAVHDLVDNKQAKEEAGKEDQKLALELPGLQAKATEAAARTAALRKELAKYENPAEDDFLALQNKMRDGTTKSDDLIVLAQAYVWTFPTSTHEGEAQQVLQQMQKKQADAQQAKKDDKAAQAAAQAKLVQRAHARDLSLEEWRNFLRDMSQEDLVMLMGQPTSRSDAYWFYSGEWIADPVTHRKVGIQINFNGGRVLKVDEMPSPP